jgi:short-subunit dehydrogenase
MSLRKNIVITGASSGLGEGMARQFAAKGRNLALCARRTDKLDALAEELRKAHGVEVFTHALDVNDHDQVFAVFKQFREELGTVDRVVINAGLGKGQPVGTGRFDANKETLETNFVAALAQAEAAMEIFRDQKAGHLVVVSSVSAVRGMPGNLTAYAASKAGVSTLAEGIRVETLGTPIKVTTLMPGYIQSEMTANDGRKSPRPTSALRGAQALVKAIESERAKAIVPAFPWVPVSLVLRCAPTGFIKKFA